jgi:hypothetical protein
MKNLGGWTRLGIVLTVLWTLVVLIELWIEFKQGPFGLGLLTDTVETGEPISSLGFRDSIPVDQVLNVGKFSSVLLIPVLSMWVLGLAWAWVRAGFNLARNGPRRGTEGERIRDWLSSRTRTRQR